MPRTVNPNEEKTGTVRKEEENERRLEKEGMQNLFGIQPKLQIQSGWTAFLIRKAE